MGRVVTLGLIGLALLVGQAAGAYQKAIRWARSRSLVPGPRRRNFPGSCQHDLFKTAVGRRPVSGTE